MMTVDVFEEVGPSLALLRAVQDILPAYVAYVDADLRYVAANRMYVERFGRPEEQIVGRLVTDVTGPAFENVSKYLRSALAGQEQRFETQMVSVDGERTLSVEHLPHRDQTGTVVGVVVYGYDITERRRAEVALLQSEKLAAVGRLASTIAHEINNPLASLTNLVYLAQTSEDISEIRGYLETAERELRRASNIAERTLSFNKRRANPTPITPRSIFENVLESFQARLVNSKIEIETRYGADVPLLGFESEIQQVLINLIGNAIDAMPNGGRLLLRGRACMNWRSNQRGLCFTVADTGSGISSEMRSKLFQAFSTTKGIGGTGIGLWVSKEIVDRHHGQITVRSRPGTDHSGTVFNVFLPFGTRV